MPDWTNRFVKAICSMVVRRCVGLNEWVHEIDENIFFLGISMELLLLRRCCYYFCYFRSCQCRCDMCIWRLLKWDGSTVPSSTTKHLTKRDVKNVFGVVAIFRVCRNNALRLIHYSASMSFVFFLVFKLNYLPFAYTQQMINNI